MVLTVEEPQPALRLDLAHSYFGVRQDDVLSESHIRSQRNAPLAGLNFDVLDTGWTVWDRGGRGVRRRASRQYRGAADDGRDDSREAHQADASPSVRARGCICGVFIRRPGRSSAKCVTATRHGRWQHTAGDRRVRTVGARGEWVNLTSRSP